MKHIMEVEKMKKKTQDPEPLSKFIDIVPRYVCDMCGVSYDKDFKLERHKVMCNARKQLIQEKRRRTRPINLDEFL